MRIKCTKNVPENQMRIDVPLSLSPITHCHVLSWLRLIALSVISISYAAVLWLFSVDGEDAFTDNCSHFGR